MHQDFRFNSRPGHVKESTNECTNRWNSKSMFLSPRSSRSLKLDFKERTVSTKSYVLYALICMKCPERENPQRESRQGWPGLRGAWEDCYHVGVPSGVVTGLGERRWWHLHRPVLCTG